ncbi:MAG: beta strand repeat-containing protein [Polymorphobacter sp.]|uniref:beta strand repeat-containing protein n=1 Tax=Polymorphobacter sp. TaxID=1909290 RepID=UPI003A84B681
MLNGSGAGSADDISTALGTLPTYDASTNTFGTDGSGVYQAVADAIDTSIAKLNADIAGGDISSETYKTILALSDALEVLNGSGAGSVADDISTALGTLPAYDASTNTFGTDGSGVYQAVADAIDTSIAKLNADIAGGDISSETYKTILALSDALEVLNGSGAGSVADDISTALGTLPAYDASTNTFGTDGSGVYQAVADAIDTSIAKLNADIAGGDISSETYKTILALSDALEVLNGSGAGSVADDISTALGTLPAYDASTNTFGTDGSGVYQAVADAIDTSIAKLNADIAGGDISSETYKTILALSDALEVLNGSGAGSVADDISTALGTLPAYDASTNTFGTDGSGVYQAVADAIDTSIAKLNADIAGGDISSETYKTILALSDALEVLNGSGAGSVADDISTALGTLPAYDASTNTFGTDGSGVYQAVADAIDTSIAKLNADIAGGDISSETYKTILALSDALEVLNGSGAGSVADDISTALGTLPAYDASTNTFGTDGSGVYQAVADAIDTSIAKLNADIAGGDISSETYKTILALSDALEVLNGSGAGSVADDISTALGTLPAYDASTNTFGTDGSGVYQAVADAIDTSIAKLNADIAGGDISSETYKTILALSDALEVLNGSGAGSVADDISTALGTLPAYDASTNTFGTDGSGVYQAVADAIDTSIAKLNADIAGGDISSETYKTILALSDALEVLNGSGAGSVADDISTALGTLPAYDASTNTFGTDGSGVYQAVADAIDTSIAKLNADIAGGDISSETYKTILALSDALEVLNGSGAGSVADDISTALGTVVTFFTAEVRQIELAPTISIVGSDLIDSVLDTSEGAITVRVSLPSAARLGDVVELYLGGLAFGTPKTDTLDASDLTNSFVDFVVTQSDLGSAGAKALTANITSSDVASNSSAGTLF